MENQRDYVERVKALVHQSYSRASDWSLIQATVSNFIVKFSQIIILSNNTKIIKLEKGQLFLHSLLKLLSISNKIEKYWLQIWKIIIMDYFGSQIKQKMDQRGEIYWDGLCIINVKQTSAKVSLGTSDGKFQLFINQLDFSENQNEQKQDFIELITMEQAIQYLLLGKQPKPSKQNKLKILDDKKLYFILDKEKKLVKFTKNGDLEIGNKDYIFTAEKSLMKQKLAKKNAEKKLVAIYQDGKINLRIASERRITESFINFNKNPKNIYDMITFGDLVIFKERIFKQNEVKIKFHEKIQQKTPEYHEQQKNSFKNDQQDGCKFNNRYYQKAPEDQYVKKNKKKTYKSNSDDQCQSFKFITQKKFLTPKPSDISMNIEYEIVASLTIKFTEIIEQLRLKDQLNYPSLRTQCIKASQRYYLSLTQFELIFDTWCSHMTFNGYKV